MKVAHGLASTSNPSSILNPSQSSWPSCELKASFTSVRDVHSRSITNAAKGSASNVEPLGHFDVSTITLVKNDEDF